MSRARDLQDVLRARGVGTVSETSGVPTGAVVQSGSNANGSFVRYADGTQLCWKRVTLAYVSTASLAATWTFPLAFSAAPVVVTTLLDEGTYGPGRGSLGAGGADNPATTTDVALFQSRDPSGTNFAAGNTIDFYCMAMGRWY
jgi:hypothetical protein